MPPLCARDLMRTNLITVRPDAPFLEVQHLFIEAQIGAAPVVDAQGAVLGIITATDLLAAVDQSSDDDLDDGEEADTLEERLADLTAIEVASPELVWVDPDATPADVVQRMRKEGVHHVLVGSAGSMLGLLTAFDLLAAVPV